MEQAELRLEGVRAKGRCAVFSQNDKVVFSRHAGQHGGLVQHRLDIEGRRAGVFKGLTRLEDRLAARDTGSRNHVLVGESDRLDLEPAGDQLDRVVRFVGDSDIVGEAVLVLARFRPLGAVGRGQTDADLVGDDLGLVVEGEGDVTGFHVVVAGKGRGRGGLGGRGFLLLGFGGGGRLGFRGGGIVFVVVIIVFFVFLRAVGLDALVFGEYKVEGAEIGGFVSTGFDLGVGGGGLALGQDLVAVFALHASGHDGCSDGADRQGCGRGVFKDLTGFQYGGAPGDALALDDVLHGGPNGLDLEAASQQLDGVRGRAVRDADRVLEAVLAHGRIRLFLVVDRGDLDREGPGHGAGGRLDRNIDLAAGDVLVSREAGASPGGFGIRGLSGPCGAATALGAQSGAAGGIVAVSCSARTDTELLAANVLDVVAGGVQCLFHRLVAGLGGLGVLAEDFLGALPAFLLVFLYLAHQPAHGALAAFLGFPVFSEAGVLHVFLVLLLLLFFVFASLRHHGASAGGALDPDLFLDHAGGPGGGDANVINLCVDGVFLVVHVDVRRRSANLFGEGQEVIDLFLWFPQLDGVPEAFVDAEPRIAGVASLEVVVGLYPSGVVLAHAEIGEVRLADLSHDGEVFLPLVGRHRLDELVVGDSVGLGVFLFEITAGAGFDQGVGIVGIELQPGEGASNLRVPRTGEFQFVVVVVVVVILVVVVVHAQIGSRGHVERKRSKIVVVDDDGAGGTNDASRRSDGHWHHDGEGCGSEGIGKRGRSGLSEEGKKGQFGLRVHRGGGFVFCCRADLLGRYVGVSWKLFSRD
mmetsp:Transcript_18574/g.38060  ORF Transcript_18574/g.38060 Transcript_18574/m.38060 type:complete len:808 (-) Transcript_18574:43-2466(-)